MSEPEYIYVRGVGWVPRLDDRVWHYATTDDGVRVRFCLDNPKLGEGWYVFNARDGINFEAWASAINKLNAQFLLEPANTSTARSAKHDNHYHYIVIEAL